MWENLSLRGCVVLVVDDDRDTLDTTTFLIAELLGCQVVEASSGHEALRLMQTTHVDLVFADIVMPRMDGLTLTTLIRQRFPALPVVLTTGLPTAVKTAQDRGAIALIKPYQPEQLVAIFREQLPAKSAPAAVSSSHAESDSLHRDADRLADVSHAE